MSSTGPIARPIPRRLPARLIAHAAALAVALLVAAIGASAAVAHVSPKARVQAAEVCEDMVRDSAVAAAGQGLIAPQRGTWNGPTYTCSYPFQDGSLDVIVIAYATDQAAARAFRDTKRRADAPRKLYGLGEQAFTDPGDNRVVARKDNFTLVVDPTKLDPALNRDSIAWSTTRAIFVCW